MPGSVWPSAGSGVVLAQEGKPSPARSEQPAVVASARSPEEKAIRAVDDAFVRDYNRGDSKALAALFTEDAEAIEAEGDRYQGAT